MKMIKYLYIFLALLLVACNRGPKMTPEEVRAKADSIRNVYGTSKATADTVTATPSTSRFEFKTQYMKDTDGRFYNRPLTYIFQTPLEKGSAITVVGGSCDLTYAVTGEVHKTDNAVSFTAFTEFNQWFSSSEIQRVKVTVYFKGEEISQIKVNGRNYYAEMPEISPSSPASVIVYKVLPKDTPSGIARKKSVSVDCVLKALNGKQLQAGQTLKIECR